MKIVKVTIENFRIFGSKTEFIINSPAAMVGENGTGKTALLEAINLATSKYFISSKISEADFSSEDNIRIQVEFDKPFFTLVPEGWNQLAIPCKGAMLIIGRRKQAAVGKALNDEFTINHFTIPFEYESHSELGTIPEKIQKTQVPVKIKTSASTEEDPFRYTAERNNDKHTTANLNARTLQITNDLIGFPNVFYFDKDRARETKKGFGSLISKIIQDLNWRYRKEFKEEDTIALWETYYNSVIESVETEKSARIIRPLQKKMVDFFGDTYEDLELSLLDVKKPFSEGFFSIRESSSSKQIISPYLGSGELMILAYYLLKIISELSKEEIIFLIDEPEMHLHLQAQKKLYKEIKESNVQFIYTTHSDVFIDIASWGSIIRCTKNDHFPKKEVLEEKISGKTIETYLDEIGPQYHDKRIFLRENNEIFFSKKCLLVEGPAEKYGIPILFQKLGLTCDDCTIIACTGKEKIHYFEKLCKAFNIDYFVLYDQDDLGKDALIESLAQPSQIDSFTTAFEKVLGITGDRNKLVKTLTKIDEIASEDIPQEVKDKVTTISTWFTS